jgi:hypothetical protein
MNRTILICSIFSSYFASCEAHAAASDAAVPKIMAFDFSIDNSSMEPTTDAERARIKAISDQLRKALQNGENMT